MMPRADPVSSPSLIRWVHTVMWGAIIVPAACFLLFAAWGYQRAMTEAEVKVTHASALSLRQAERVFEVALKVAAMGDGATIGSDAEVSAHEESIHRRFSDLCAGLGFVVNMNVWATDGSPLIRSDLYPVDRTASVIHRSYFINQKASTEPVGVGDVLIGRQSGRELFNVTMRRQALNGNFNGIIAVSLAPEFFRSYYQSLSEDEPGLASFALIRTDGAILARWPSTMPGHTQVAADNPILLRVRGGATSGLVLVDERAGFEGRLISFRRVEGLPLYVTAGVSRASVVSGWLKFSALLFAGFLCVALGLFWISWVALRKTRDEAERTAERNRLWNNSREIITVANVDGTISSVNPAATAILGWAPDELIGRSVSELVHPEDLARAHDGGPPAGQDTAPRLTVNRFLRKDGSYSAISWSSSTENGQVYSQGRDITSEMQQAEALRVAEDAMRQSQKMDAVGQLTGGIAHDFNNLLTAIGGSLQLVQARVEQGRFAEIGRYLSAAEAALKRAAALTHRLLAFSRRQTLDPRPVDVNRLLAGIDDLLRRAIGPGIDVDFIMADGLWTALVDANQLENAVLNLCINARDAMPDGGKLTIETANRWLDEREARLRDVSPGPYLTVRVADTGAGMSTDVQKRAFEPFFTTKPLGMGTGLGLSMIYGFAKQSGGQVRIESEVGKGTAVTIYLPRHLGDANDEGVASDSTVVPARRANATILVVDDETTIRMFVVDVLRECGYETREAADGQQGLSALRDDRVTLLITDVGLPGGMNGRQLADAARASRPDLKVLFITGYAENAAVGNGPLDSGMAILTKPFDIESLKTKVASMLEAE